MSRRKRVAVVGAGPAGAFTAIKLRERSDGPDVDVFERLPTPWGLLRGGVAPDHFEIKALATTFEKGVFGRGSRFFGNVEVGRDLSHADLRRHYDAVVYAVGAQTDKSLGIPGEELDGSLPATDFVGWYNGHPDYRDLGPDLSHETAVVIGNGNVAADVARLLAVDPDELASTDIADHALEALRASNVKRVVVIGRRGPAQAAFTSKELRELGRLPGAAFAIDPSVLELDAVTQDWLGEEGTYTAQVNLELLREFASADQPDAPRTLELRFLQSPVVIHGDDGVQSIELALNEIVRSDDGGLRARPVEGAEHETIECGLVLRSVGYQAVPLPDVPFDTQSYVLPNQEGRVIDLDTGERLPGVYAVGWVKRGPTGILGTNKRDAAETARSVIDDLDAGELPEPEESSPEALDKLLAGLDRPVSADGWKAIDAAERDAGHAQDRPRVKYAARDELLDAAG